MPHKILVVDDDPDILDLIRTILAGAGFQVLTSSDGKHAVSLFERHKGIDLVVADVAMPAGLLGPEVVELLKRLDRHFPCMLMSGQPDDYVHQLCVPGLGSAFIRKPFQPQDLVNKIRRLLHSTRKRERRRCAAAS